MAETRQFQRWGWVIAAALGLFDALMVNDLFLLRAGEHGIWTRWHGAPWPFVLLLAAPLAHLWLLVIIVLRGLERERGRADVSRELVTVLLATVAVFHALIWDNGGWVKRLMSLGR